MQVKKIIIASDHAGYELKQKIIEYLKSKNYLVTNIGTNSLDPVDYPDKAYMLARGILSGEANYGILICGTGIGMSIAVNRFKFIRGALVYDEKTATLARLHNNANVLVLGARITPIESAKKIIDAFFSTNFEEGRHKERVRKLMEVPNVE